MAEVAVRCGLEPTTCRLGAMLFARRTANSKRLRWEDSLTFRGRRPATSVPQGFRDS